MSTDELACTYAALILHDEGLAVTADKINTLINAAGLSVKPFWPALFEKVLAGKNIDDLLLNVGAGTGAPAAAAPAAAPAAGKEGAGKEGAGKGGKSKEPPKEEKKPPEPEPEEEDMGLSLFD